MPIFECVCTTTECPENVGHYPTSHRVIEVLCKADETPICEACGSGLTKLISAVPGYVIGTSTYTRCK